MGVRRDWYGSEWDGCWPRTEGSWPQGTGQSATEQPPKLAGGVAIEPLKPCPLIQGTVSPSVGWWEKVGFFCNAQSKEPGGYGVLPRLPRE